MSKVVKRIDMAELRENLGRATEVVFRLETILSLEKERQATQANVIASLESQTRDAHSAQTGALRDLLEAVERDVKRGKR